MTKKQKKSAFKIILAFLLFVIAEFLPVTGAVRFLCFFIAYLPVGAEIVWKAIRNLLHGQIFDENFLMAVATIGAFAIQEYPEAVAVMLFYQVGELFQSYAVHRSRRSITGLMDIRPDYANIERGGNIVQVDPGEVMAGDEIIIRPGEKIPLDGIVIEGSSMADTAALTGESVPRSLKPGSEAISGCINQTGVIKIKVTKEFGESTVSKILDLVENASNKKAKTENFITKFAKVYTPAVVAAAVILAVIPPLILPDAVFSDWLQRALLFLVISCPCALVISIPLGFFGGIGGASKNGILIKGSNYLEALSDAKIVLFDKTGTLTKGTFKVTKIQPEGITKKELLKYTALAESSSSHPIAVSILKEYGAEPDYTLVKDIEEIAGFGITAMIESHKVAAGNLGLLKKMNIAAPMVETPGTIVYLAVDDNYAGYLVISDEIKEDSKEAISLLKEKKCHTVMLTGDRREAGETVAGQLGLDEVFTELLPTDKVEKMEQFLQKKTEKEKLIFVGDGINDAPVLSGADIGIAMGGLGSDAAMEAADIVIMDDKPSKIAAAIDIAKRTRRIVKQNIVFALVIKAIVLILGAFGAATMWEAVFADVGVSVIAILNAMRALNSKGNMNIS